MFHRDVASETQLSGLRRSQAGSSTRVDPTLASSVVNRVSLDPEFARDLRDAPPVTRALVAGTPRDTSSAQ
jgi:hypothetical protein